MFLLWKNILWIPIGFLCVIGEPFKWDNNGSNLKNISEAKIKEEYNKAKFNHYFKRILTSTAFIIGCLIFLFLIILSNGFILMIFPLITLIVLLIDAFMCFCRFIYHLEEVKEAESRNELVVVDDWKDTSLNSLLRTRSEERKRFAKEYEEKTGRVPNGYELDRIMNGYPI